MKNLVFLGISGYKGQHSMYQVEFLGSVTKTIVHKSDGFVTKQAL